MAISCVLEAGGSNDLASIRQAVAREDADSLNVTGKLACGDGDGGRLTSGR